MKKQITFLIGVLFVVTLSLISNLSFGQWTQGAGLIWTNDKVGIGQSNPEHPLYILNDQSGLPMSTQEKVVDAVGGAALLMRRARGTYGSKTPLLNNDVIGGLFGQTFDGSSYRSAASIRFFADGNASAGSVPTKILFQTTANGTTYLQDRMIIRENGLVGIGTSNPQSLLSVNGKITATEIEVTLSGWSDFVFKDDYSLKPLKEVDHFIKTNGHLPDVPKESEVLNNGVNLGEMSALLLQKIEELTLYVIELNQKNEELETKIANLIE
jgi:hypothetical protein